MLLRTESSSASLNTICPGSIKKINTQGAGFKLMENIAVLQTAMLEYGVDKADIFQTNDLFERKDLGAVTNTIFALDRAVGRHPEWTGARLQGQAGAQQSVYFNQN